MGQSGGSFEEKQVQVQVQEKQVQVLDQNIEKKTQI